MKELANVAIDYLRAVTDRSPTWGPEKSEVTEALDTVQAELDAALTRLAELEAIEDRAREWDHDDSTEAERHVARRILGRA